MASNAIRRRAFSISSSFLRCSAASASTSGTHSPLQIPNTPSYSLTTTGRNVLSLESFFPSSQTYRRFLHSTPLSLSSYRSDADNFKFDENEPLFEGCDYKHWLITMEFPNPTTREEMIETYIQTLAKVVGSVEEAKKRMYAFSTTTYVGFQAEVDEETANKFEGMPGVVFVLPDSYIDPINKEYGGDKYENGIITPRPPPVQYGRMNGRQGQRRDRDPSRMQGGGRSSMQQNSGPSGNYYGPPGNIPPSTTNAASGNYQRQSNYNSSGYNTPQQANYAAPGNEGPTLSGNYQAPPYSSPPRQGERTNTMPLSGGDYPGGGRDNYDGGRSTSAPQYRGHNQQTYQNPQQQRGYPSAQPIWSEHTSSPGGNYGPPPPSQGSYGHTSSPGGNYGPPPPSQGSYGHSGPGLGYARGEGHHPEAGSGYARGEGHHPEAAGYARGESHPPGAGSGYARGEGHHPGTGSGYARGEGHHPGTGSGFVPIYTEYRANEGFGRPQNDKQDDQSNYEPMRQDGRNQRY